MTFGTVADAAASVVAILLITAATLAVLRVLFSPADAGSEPEEEP